MANLGVDYIQLVPSLKGAVGTIQKELSGINLGSVSKSLGDKLSAGLGSGLKANLAKATEQAALSAKKPLEAATQSLTKAQDALTKAQNAGSRATEKVARYEQRLSDLQAAGKENTKTYANTQAKLADAQNQVAMSAWDVAAAQIGVDSAQAGLAKTSAEVDAALAKQQTGWGRLAITAPVVADGLKTAGAALKTWGGQIADVGRNLTRHLTIPALGVATALGGIVVAAGWKRLVAIDTAQAQLKGLGHSAESIQSIMDSALATVKGTSYGLGEAATVAATAVAAGVRSGGDLTRYLTNVGDAAAIAGVSLGEMGSIFNKVQTAGRAYTMELNMLADRGLPIYQWLADAAGTSAEAVRDMAAKGEISSQMYFDAIEKNIGGAAKIIGQESLTGAISNAWAAVGRLGASFLDAGGKGGGFFSQLKPLIGDFTASLDNAAPVAERMGVAAGKAFARLVDHGKKLHSMWRGLSPETQKLIGKLALVAIAAGPVLTVVGKLVGVAGSLMTGLGGLVGWIGKLAPGFAAAAGAGGAGGFLQVITKFLGPIGLVVGAFIALWTQSETFRDSVGRLVTAVWDAGQRIWEALGPVLESIGNLLGPLFETAADIIVRAIEWVLPYIDDWADKLVGLIEAAQPLVDFLTNVLGPAFEMFGDVVSAVMDGLEPVVDAGMSSVSGTLTAWTQILNGDWSGAWNTIVETHKSNWEKIKTGAKDGFESLKTSARTWAVDAVARFSSTWVTIAAGTATAMTGLGLRVATGTANVIAKIIEMKNRIVGFFANAGSWLIESGRSLISGFATGIISAAQSAVNAVSDVVQKVRDWLPFSPARVGPFSGRGWTLYSGQSLIEAFAQGVTSKRSLLTGAIEGVMAAGDAAMGMVASGGSMSPVSRFASSADVSTALSGPFQLLMRDGNGLRELMRGEIRSSEDSGPLGDGALSSGFGSLLTP